MTAASPSSTGLLHPYQPVFAADGTLYVSSQDTNVVTAFHGPGSAQPGTPMSNSKFLLKHYADGTFNPGTFVPALSADARAPQFTPVPADQGGLTFTAVGKTQHSVRGLAFDSAGNLYVADEANDRVAVFDADGKLLGAVTGSHNDTLSAPVALCYDAARNTLYIGSPGNKRLFSYDVSGVTKDHFTANALIQDAALDKLSGIAVDPDGNLYTGDRKANKIHRWRPDGSPRSLFAGPFHDSPEQIIAVYTPIVG